MGNIPGAQGHQAAAHQGNAGILDLIPEAAAQTQQGVGQDIVQRTHDQGVDDHGAVTEVAGLEGGGDGVGTQSHLHQGVGKAGNQTPLYAVAVGNQYNGQHAYQGQLSAEGHGRDNGSAHDLQHYGHGDQHGAFGQSFGFCCHVGDTSINKNITLQTV